MVVHWSSPPIHIQFRSGPTVSRSLGCPVPYELAEAAVIMNLLKVQYYKELLRRMGLYSQSRNHKKYLVNVMNLLLACIRNLPSFSLEKVEVLFSCVLRNIVLHFIDEDRIIANKAIEVVTNICLIKGNPLLNTIFNQIQCSRKFINITIEALLLSFNQIVDEKWGNSPRNQNLLVIMSRFLTYSQNMNNELVQKTLNSICKDCTPFSLKPSLPILHELFCVMALKEETDIARAVLKIIFRNAMHQDATSAAFLDHIFKSLLVPSIIDNTTYSPKYYYNIFLTSEFEYEALFTKCQKNIREEHIERIIQELDYEEPGGAVLLCCLLNYCKYEETTVLAEFFIQNFAEIATRANMGPLSIALNKILINKTLTEQDIPQLDVLQSLIMEALFEQTFQVPCIKPAFSLLQEIRKLLRIDLEDQILNQLLVVTSERAFRRLHRREIGDNSVFMYLNELCLLMKKPPTEYVVRMLESYMEDSTKIQEIKSLMPEIYIQLLTLFTTLAMMNKKKVPMAINYLREVLYNDHQIVQILAFKLFFSLCQEMTHEYDEVITFVFREIVRADPCLIRICVISIEELIHEDFVKLSSEDFFKFVYVLGCEDLVIFMKDVLTKRFILSNQNDIAKFYVQTIVYIHMYSKLPNYPISPQFDEDLVRIKLKMNAPNEVPAFLFHVLSLKKKFNVLCEISSIFEDLIRGQCKIENNFFDMLKDLILTFKFLATSNKVVINDKHYYNNVCKEIESRMVNYDASFETKSYYGEYEAEIKRCTIILLKLLFFENDQLADKIQLILFDTVIHWIDFVKAEIISYLHLEKGREYGQYFSKLVQYYKRNKAKFVFTNR
ncbi:uncharacterized protein isoform X3 [Leptinotarsa decemlineata]|uniref:uncharacterized protein isoform X3 n=1 Tax=Leptinotarsa decemlineata TaxID=7539 RepID=UPI003D30CBF5